MQNLNNIEYKLDAPTINSLKREMNGFINFIDPFQPTNISCRFISRGRQVFQLKEGAVIWIVVERDLSTRYIINRTEQNASGGRTTFQSIVKFEGCKMQEHRYIQSGQFCHFQLVKLKQELSYRYLPAQKFPNSNLYKCTRDNGGYHLLAYVKQEKIVYFDKELKVMKQESRQMTEKYENENVYFDVSLSQSILTEIENKQKINSKALNYFFKRLAFSCTTRSWSAENLGIKLIIKEVFNWNKFPIDNIDRLLKIPEKGCYLTICPIYQSQGQHFVLIVIQTNDGYVKKVYELDSLGSSLIIQHRQGINYQYVSQINGPKQILGSDCGLFCLVYALLLTHKYQLLPLSSATLSILCNQQKIDSTMSQLRMFLSQSYRDRNYHFLEDVLLALRE